MWWIAGFSATISGFLIVVTPANCNSKNTNSEDLNSARHGQFQEKEKTPTTQVKIFLSTITNASFGLVALSASFSWMCKSKALQFKDTSAHKNLSCNTLMGEVNLWNNEVLNWKTWQNQYLFSPFRTIRIQSKDPDPLFFSNNSLGVARRCLSFWWLILTSL